MSNFLSALPLPESIQQQFVWLEQMRSSQPVFHDTETGIWHVFRYEDVNSVLRTPAHFSSHAHALREMPLVEGEEHVPPEEREKDPFGQSFLAMDPPRHRLYRGLVSQAFTPRAITQLTPRITEITQSLLDRARSQGSMEVVGDLTYPLPATVIAELLGVPLEQRDELRLYTNALVGEVFTQETDKPLSEQQAVKGMAALFLDMLKERRRQPREDMMSDLVKAELDGQHLTDEEMISFCILLFIAGHETTTRLLGSFLMCLAESPELQQRLRSEPDLIAGMTEEVLRTIPPVFSLPRLTTTDVALADVRIPAEQMVLIWLASANYDSIQFPDPNMFDITRTPNRHLSFGHGIHVCLGAPLARLETTIVIKLLLQQFTDIRRIETLPIEFSSIEAVFGVKRLSVSFRA